MKTCDNTNLEIKENLATKFETFKLEETDVAADVISLLSVNELSASSRKMLKIKTSDDAIFEVQENLAVKSGTLKCMVEDDVTDGVIPLSNVDGSTMAKIIEWWKEHVNKDDDDPTDELKSWEAKFLDTDTDTLYDLLMAANYLNISDLLNKICRQVADLIKGKSVMDIRKLFNIRTDFTVEEEGELMKHNPWAFQ